MVKNKFTLIGTDNDGFRHRYSIKKNEGFKKAFSKFMEDLDFDPKKIEQIFFTYNEKDAHIELKVTDFEDDIIHLQNKKFDVDVFFGRFKIIVVVRTKGRIPLVRHLETKSKWVKPPKIKKIRKKTVMKAPLPKIK